MEKDLDSRSVLINWWSASQIWPIDIGLLTNIVGDPYSRYLLFWNNVPVLAIKVTGAVTVLND